MRPRFWISLGLMAALGACSQSLSGNLTGTGGAGAVEGTGSGTGAGGKVGTGAGGTVGYDRSACQALAAEYDTAMTAARSCTAGSTTQCAQPVPSALSACGACPAFVTDASKLNAIQQLWQAANCDVPIPCPSSGACPSGVPDVCVPGPNGQGLCSYATGTGTGGSTGAGGSQVDGGSPDVCNAYAVKYGIVLESVKSCSVGAAGQCAHSVLSQLSVCSAGCFTYVNDRTDLDQLRLEWDRAGCDRAAVACPAISCVAAVGGACSATDAGGGVCSTTYQGFTLAP